MRLLAELKRRNVFRMAGLYLVGAWLIVQVAGTVFPMFGAPEWAARSVVLILAIAFIPALVASWVFELTPEGLKRETEGAATTLSPVISRRLDRMLMLGMALALSYFAFDKFVLAPSRAAADTRQEAEQTNAAPSTLPRGIAVLPLANLSPDPDNAFFSGGVYEEILTRLARIPQLRVISRTSMERIAKEGLEVRAIGERLGVSHVLEGSVRRSRDQIRVTVQLIEAATDTHVWAENYDRKLDDLFAIQSEIALAIADQLEIKLSRKLRARLDQGATPNPAAYALYLRALAERRNWQGSANSDAVIELLEPAVAADANFLDAMVLLADAYGRLVWLNDDADGTVAARAQQLVAQIATQWPKLGQSRLAQGQLAYNLDRDYAAALVHFEAARKQLPNDVTLLLSLSATLKRLGKDAAFLETARQIVAIDPESSAAGSELFLALLTNGLLDETVEFCEQAVTRFPEDPGKQQDLAIALLVRDQDSASALALRLDVGSWNVNDPAALARFVHGQIDALAEVSVTGMNDAFMLADRSELLAWAGRDDRARELQQRAQVLLQDSAEVHSSMSAWDYAVLARATAMFDRAQAQALLSQALALPPPGDYTSRALFDLTVAHALRRLDRQEEAWLRVQAYAGKPAWLSDGELLAFRAYYERAYARAPSYHAYMRKLAEQLR